ncbi:MAG: 2Fe-2S iron-sulfur cluster-binding protein [Acidimicrobiales bacterium]|jgi:ring-1,2-phenylacetyl-CoA epoxidase subunit PaaE
MTGTATALTTPPSRFVPVRVTSVEPLTHDSVVVELASLGERQMGFLAGQHLTLRRLVDGTELRRTYSICASAPSGDLRIGVKRLEGGVVSGWVNDVLAPGDVLEVMAPAGRFTPRLDPMARRRYVAVAAGSGITPILSILMTVLEVEPQSTAVLWFGNKTTRDIMFLEELCDLKDRYPDRFEVLFFLSREEQEIELLTGRIDGDRVRRLLSNLQPAGEVDEWFLCGPFTMVNEVRAALAEAGVEQARIHAELFHVDGEMPRAARAARSALHEDWGGRVSEVTIVLNGRATTVAVPYDGDPVLDSLIAARSDAPYSCTSGVCGTCRARVVAGAVEMDVAYALEPDETERGYVLMCQSHPTTESVRLEVD